MSTKAAWILALSIAFAPAAWAADAQADDIEQAAATLEDAPAPASYDIYIDGLTGYTFVRTPAGWKFVHSLFGAARCEGAPAQR